MKILYLGSCSSSSTGYHKAKALARMGHTVFFEDPYLIAKNKTFKKFFDILNYRSGYSFLQKRMGKWLSCICSRNVGNIEVVWVDSGELFGPSCLKILRENNFKIILYNHDDPTGGRDGRRFLQLIKSIPYYDLCAVVREESFVEFNALGAKSVIKIWRSYDELEHAPFNDISEIPSEFRSDVAFIGTWMRNEGRDKFIIDLVSKGIPVSIWGSRWDKSPFWIQLKPFFRGKELKGRDYVAAIQGAKICLGLLSSGNRDLHTTRSLEIPYAGGLFCGQRTTEHEYLYLDGAECLLWSDVNECAEKCMNLLGDDFLREKIRAAGSKRVRSNKVGHEDQCRIILERLSG